MTRKLPPYSESELAKAFANSEEAILELNKLAAESEISNKECELFSAMLDDVEHVINVHGLDASHAIFYSAIDQAQKTRDIMERLYPRLSRIHSHAISNGIDSRVADTIKTYIDKSKLLQDQLGTEHRFLSKQVRYHLYVLYFFIIRRIFIAIFFIAYWILVIYGVYWLLKHFNLGQIILGL